MNEELKKRQKIRMLSPNEVARLKEQEKLRLQKMQVTYKGTLSRKTVGIFSIFAKLRKRQIR